MTGRMVHRLSRRFTDLAAAAALVLLAGGAADASANAAICRQLENQLAAVSRPASAQSRRYDKAIADQKAQIENARAQQKEMGCGFFSFRSECSAAKATLKRMEDNLAALERTRGGMSEAGGKREQTRVLALLRSNGCRDETRSAARGGTQRDGTLFDHLFGRSGGARGVTQDPDTIADNASSGTRWSGGNFRTLCVRTCDGYYFPISYSSNRGDFDRDSKACAAMCPGTETALYHHRVPQQESEDMVSAATGTPYSDLPTAFDYRAPGFTRSASCGCGAPKEYSIVAGEIPEDGVAAVPPQPQPRPDMAEDPELAANRAGGLDIATLKKLLTPPEPEPMPVASISAAGASPAERAVRVVGPAFLPDPEGAIDLRAPARREIR